MVVLSIIFLSFSFFFSFLFSFLSLLLSLSLSLSPPFPTSLFYQHFRNVKIILSSKAVSRQQAYMKPVILSLQCVSESLGVAMKMHSPR